MSLARGGRAVCALLVALALGASAITGCALQGLAFVQDDRVEIVSPKNGDSISLPFDLSWRTRDFDGSYVVFFDRSPMRPNEDLLSLVGETDPCRALSDCPTESWLRERDIYVVSESRVHVDRLPDYRQNNRSRDRHIATIVLFDKEGHRVGESAFIVEFFIDRKD